MPNPTRPPELKVSTTDERCDNCAWWYPSRPQPDMWGRCGMYGGYITLAMQKCRDYEHGRPGNKGEI